jgi:hypothetical protein
VGSSEAVETKSNTRERRRTRRVRDKIARLAESTIVSIVILQHFEKAPTNLQRGEDQVDMKLNDHTEPEQAGVGKEQNVTTPVSLIGDTQDFMNVGIELEGTSEVELPHHPDWSNHEEQGPEAEVTIADTVDYSKEERAEVSPLGKL